MGHTIQFLKLGTRLSIAQKVNGQGHQAALLSAALTREAGAAVTVIDDVLRMGNYCYTAAAA